MLTRNTVLFVFILFCSIKCITGREEANYALRAMFEDLLQEQDNSNENDQLINKRGVVLGCQDTYNWYNKWSGANNGKGWTCSDYSTTQTSQQALPWCQNGAVTKGSEWAMGAKFNYPEKNCCVCGKGKN